jgi:hypothetical protein
MAYHTYHGLETRIVRIFNTYGPRMRLNDGRVLPAFIGQALRGEDLTIFGDGTQTRSFCYVDDLVEGIYRLLLSDYAYPVNIGNPSEITMNEFAEEIIKLTGTDQKIVTDNLSINAPSLNINCSNDLKLTAGSAMYVETPSLIRTINFPPTLPRAKAGIFTLCGGSYDMFLYPSATGADAVPRYTVNNTAGPISMLVGAGGFFVTVGAGVATISVAAGALTLTSLAGGTFVNGASAVSITSAGVIDLKAPFINLN